MNTSTGFAVKIEYEAFVIILGSKGMKERTLP
jgi:hypothetical protein